MLVYLFLKNKLDIWEKIRLNYQINKMNNSILQDIEYPEDLRKLTKDKLPKICEELRNETINIVSKTHIF